MASLLKGLKLDRSSAQRNLLLAATVFALYWLAAQLGFIFSNHGILTPVWPAAAVGATAAILYGPRSLWLAAIYVFVDLVDGQVLDMGHLRRSWIEPLGLLVSAVVVGGLAKRMVFDLRFRTLQQVGILLCISATYAGINGIVVAAGYCGLLNIASCARSGIVSYWLQSFTGDFFGCLIAMPALISWARRLDPQTRAKWPDSPDAAADSWSLESAQWGFILAGSVCIGLSWVGTHRVNLPVSAVGFLVLPLLVWAALQFRPLFVHTTIVATGLIAISLQLTASTVTFKDPETELASLFLFLLSSSVLTLIVNVIVQQQQSMARSLVYREEQERIELMLQVATDAVLSFDAHGLVSYFNPAAERLLVREGVALQGGDIAKILPSPRLINLARIGIVELMKNDAALFSGAVFELELSGNDNVLLTLEVALTAYPKNSQWNATAFIRDVTTRKHQEEALRKTSRELETILQSTLVGITHTVDRIHVWGNRKFAEMMGYEQQELVGRSTQLHFQDQKSWLDLGELSGPSLRAGLPFVAEWPVRHRSGSIFWCELHGNTLDPTDLSKGAIWSFLDISQRKQAEAELRRALAHQRELNDLKSRFVSMTSHEFRTPLSTILSSSELLNFYGDRLPEQEKQSLYQGIQVAVARMTTMMDDVLVIGQADEQRIEMKLEMVDLDKFCMDLVEECRLSAQPPIAIKYSSTDCRQVSMDGKLVRRVLANLLSNAIKYSPSGGTIHFDAIQQSHGLQFSVSDQGIGIPDDDIPRLFESFHRATNVGNISGTGLGLSIVKKSLERQGGSIEVTSRVGHGTIFLVKIPLPQERYI